jgi:hypothetical protein
MFSLNFIIIVLTSITTNVSVLWVMIKWKTFVIPEMKLLFLGLVCVSTIFIGSIPIVYYYEVLMMDYSEILVLYNRVIFAITQLGILFISFAITLTNYRPNYRSIRRLSSILTFNVAAIVASSYTIEHHIVGGSIILEYDPFALFMSSIAVLYLPYLVIRQIGKISKIMTSTSTRKHSRISLVFFSLFLIFTVISLIISQNTTLLSQTIFLQLPSFFFAIPASIGFMLFCHIFRKNSEFLFITNAHWEDIFVINKDNNITLYTESFGDTTDRKHLLAGLLSILSTSLPVHMDSNSDLTDIILGDKVILITPGNWIYTIMVVSEKNLIIESISSHLTSKFEELYPKSIFNDISIIDQQLFSSYQQEIIKMRRFIPL